MNSFITICIPWIIILIGFIYAFICNFSYTYFQQCNELLACTYNLKVFLPVRGQVCFSFVHDTAKRGKEHYVFPQSNVLKT